MTPGDEPEEATTKRVLSRRPSVGPATASPASSAPPASVGFDLDKLEVHYSAFRAVRDVTLQIRDREITAFIGPSGCGKTTVLRCLNRMNDLIAGARVTGKVSYHGIDLYGASVSVTEVRRRIDMVFQSRTPSPRASTTTLRTGRGSTACAEPSSTRSSRGLCVRRRCATRSRLA